jgi:superfamily II DNA or RNA helicase
MEQQVIDRIIAGTRVQPRPYQARIVGKLLQMYGGQFIGKDGKQEVAAKSIMIESPTGSGKSIMGLVACKGWQAQVPDLHVAWVAMRRNLLSQAAVENSKKEVNVRNIHFISMFEQEPEAILRAKQAGKPILMVIDECQHDCASSMTHLHNILTPQYVLGLTATPFRTDKMKLCFDKVIKDAGIHALIQDGYLSRFDHYTIDEWSPQAVCDRYCDDPVRWGKSIFYFKNTQECFDLQRLLLDRGHVSEVVTGGSDCDAQIQRFRDGDIQCLINCMKLTEGFDEPSLKTAWVRDSGKGCTMQMGGRAFRLHTDTPRKNIVQSKNTRWPFIKTAMPVLQYVWQNESWVSLTINPKINTINENARVAIAMTDVSMPNYIKARMKKSVRKIRF